MSKVTEQEWTYGPAQNYEGFYIAPKGLLPTFCSVERGAKLQDGSRSHVVHVNCFNFPGETEEIARMLAAAPKLLAALEALLRVYGSTDALSINAREAVMQARGEL